MNATEWLSARPIGFAQLSADERSRIAEFALLWTYFEAIVFATDASNPKIVKLAEAMSTQNQIDLERVQPAVNHLRDRYVNDGVLTDHYEHLHLPDKYEPRVRAMLLGNANSPMELLCAALLITFRYRNNLFHGIKWAYGVHGQLSNFDMAIDLLEPVIEMRNL